MIKSREAKQDKARKKELKERKMKKRFTIIEAIYSSQQIPFF